MSSNTGTRAAATLGDSRWAAVLARDPSADGQFFYSVGTTGVYCRPSCASRTARPENVAFHDSAEAAERAGFRPCKRCRPNEPAPAQQHAALVARLCRLIDDSEQAPNLEALAQAAGLSPYHLHRVFKAITGLTPRAYARALRADRIRTQLHGGAGVTEAIYGAGYASSGRFYEQADQILGMKPGAYRAGGTNADIRFALGQCSLGAILVAASERGVCAVLLGDEPEALIGDLMERFPQARVLADHADFATLVDRVVAFVEAPGHGLDLPLDLRGTIFQQRVWQALRSIPAGSTVSYTEIARRIGAPQAVRAVAQACAANPLAVVVPCHRVVRNDGTLSGYRWGVERKRALLEREKKA